MNLKWCDSDTWVGGIGFIVVFGAIAIFFPVFSKYLWWSFFVITWIIIICWALREIIHAKSL